jgi:hypothetical protein
MSLTLFSDPVSNHWIKTYTMPVWRARRIRSVASTPCFPSPRPHSSLSRPLPFSRAPGSLSGWVQPPLQQAADTVASWFKGHRLLTKIAVRAAGAGTRAAQNREAKQRGARRERAAGASSRNRPAGWEDGEGRGEQRERAAEGSGRSRRPG